MSVTLTWYGHSAFGLESDGTKVLIDPFLSDNPVATTSPDEVEASTILLTHAHNDHVGDTASIAERCGAKVIATYELANFIASKGIEDTVGGNHGGTIEFDGGSVKFVPAWHTSSYQEGNQVVAPGIPAGLVVRFGGKTIYFAGDTCLFSDMKLIAEEGLDVAIVPIGDHFTMGPMDAARAAEWLGAGTVIPCHYNTFPPIKQDAQAFKTDVEGRTNATVVILQPGESTGL